MSHDSIVAAVCNRPFFVGIRKQLESVSINTFAEVVSLHREMSCDARERLCEGYIRVEKMLRCDTVLWCGEWRAEGFGGEA